MYFRYVDRPVEMFEKIEGRDILDEMDKEGTYIAQYKADGWCTVVGRDDGRTTLPDVARTGGCAFWSRRDQKKGGPTALPVSEKVAEEIGLLNIPDKSALAAEWMARRTVGELPEKLFIFDVLWWKDEWLGEWTFEKRLNLIHDEILPKLTLATTVQCMPSFYTGFREVFDGIKSDARFSWTEGLVLKRRSAKLKGDNLSGKDNGGQVKIKWRSGASGREVFK